MALIWLPLSGHSPPLRAIRTGSAAEVTEEYGLQAPAYLIYTSQPHLPRDGAAQSRRGSPTPIINLEDISRTSHRTFGPQQLFI